MKPIQFILKVVFYVIILITTFSVLNIFAETRNEYFQKWNQLEKEHNFQLAIPLFKKAISEFPNESWFYIYVAHSYKILKQPKNAIPYYEKAGQLAPENKEIVNNVYFGFLDYAGEIGYRDMNWTDAIIWYQKAIDLAPKRYQAYNLMGNTLRNAGRLNDGLSYLEKALELNSSHVKGGALSPNFLVTLEAGLFQKDTSWAARWADLAVQAFPHERKLIATALMLYTETNQSSKLNKLKQTAHQTNHANLIDSIFLLSSEPDRAVEKFYQMSGNHPNDFELDQLISHVISLKLHNLGYYELMNHPLHNEIIAFAHLTVKKYFRLNPFHQNATLTSPLKGRFCVVQGAGGKSFHYGLAGHFSYDLVRCKNDSTGTPIFAIADGIVSSVHDSEPDLPAGTPVKLNRKANIIEIKHEWATSCYVHNKQYSALVQVGQHVIQGQKIAEIGNSGVSAGPHLHFAVKNQKGYTLPVQFSNLTGYSEKDGVFKPLKTLQTDYEYKVK